MSWAALRVACCVLALTPLAYYVVVLIAACLLYTSVLQSLSAKQYQRGRTDHDTAFFGEDACERGTGEERTERVGIVTRREAAGSQSGRPSEGTGRAGIERHARGSKVRPEVGPTDTGSIAGEI